MVCDTVKPSLRAASCWRVEVVNGGAGDFFTGRTLTDDTLKLVPLHSASSSRAWASSVRRFDSSAPTAVPSAVANRAFTR